jgi:DsbC/DsbD-like thiol-disulfide interchange protein
MSKCYPIARRLQTMRCAQSLRFVPQFVGVPQSTVADQNDTCAGFTSFASDYWCDARAHDEFNGLAKVSSLDRIVMIVTVAIGRLRPAAAALAVACVATAAQAGEDASRWDGDARSAVRLIAGSRADASAPLRAGIEIRLAPGWHTYWRYPGDAGVPPRFDFAGSRNVDTIDVLFPAPKRLPEAGLIAIGYDHNVILPLAIVAQDPAKPLTLRLKLDYAVCEKLCVPADGKAELTLAVGPSTMEGAFAAAEARVPKRLKLNEGGTLSIRSVKREEDAPKPRVIVDVATPPGVAVDLFAEGPTPEWALPLPMPVAGAPAGLQRFAFDLDGAPPGEKYQGAQIVLTAVAGNEAIEVAIRLD